MRKNNTKRNTIIFVCKLLVLFAVAFSIAFSFCASLELFHHDCTGEDCPVCNFIFVCRAAFRYLATAFAVLFCGYVCFAANRFFAPVSSGDRIVFSPVRLGVKLNN